MVEGKIWRKKTLSGFWDGKYKIRLFGKEENRREVEKMENKKTSGTHNFLSFQHMNGNFFKTMKSTITLLSIFKRLNNKINEQNSNCIGK